MDNILKPAGFWIRLGALIIDGLILGMFFWLISSLINQKLNTNQNNITQVLYLFLGAIYYIAFLSSSWQATPGKRLLNIFIVRTEDNQKISKVRALSRYIIFSVPDIMTLVASLFIATSDLPLIPTVSEADRQRIVIISDKLKHQQSLTQEENIILMDATLPKTIPNLSDLDQQRYAAIRYKQIHNQKLLPGENEFIGHAMSQMMFSGPMPAMMLVELLSCIYGFILVFTVALKEQKTGLHDMICKTRALRGRPENILTASA